MRDFLKSRLKNAAVSRITIERPAKNARITIFSARPGVVIGKKGEDIEKFYAEMARVIDDPAVKIVPVPQTRPPSPASRLDTEMYRVMERVSKRCFLLFARKLFKDCG